MVRDPKVYPNGMFASLHDPEGNPIQLCHGKNENFVLGFLRASDGTITLFNATGANSTGAVGINDNGDITGTYGSSSQIGGYVRAADGTFTTFDYASIYGTYPMGINSKGEVTGVVGCFIAQPFMAARTATERSGR